MSNDSLSQNSRLGLVVWVVKNICIYRRATSNSYGKLLLRFRKPED